MSRTKLFAAALVAVSLVAVGCAKPPQQELDAAKAAMAEVEAAGASKWAPEAWAKVQEGMNAVTAEVDAQNAKFALLRSYSKAKELLAAFNTTVADAKTAAAAGKEQWRNDAQAAVDAAKAAATATQTAMTDLEGCKRKPMGFAKDMEMLKGSFDSLNGQLAGLDGQMTSEDYQGAKSAAESLKGQLDSLAAEFANAKTKIKC
jgi:chromosome segregation ATPase